MKWWYYFSFYTGFIILILIGAYSAIIPTEIAVFPMYDLVGHFMLYGIWFYLLHKSLNCTTISVLNTAVPNALLILFPIVALEEFAQMFASTRTFSLVDLFWGFVGMCIFWMLSSIFQDKASSK